MASKIESFTDEILDKAKKSIAKALRGLADSVEERISMKWVIIGLAVLYFWKKK